MLLTRSANARLAKTLGHGITAHLIRIHLRDIVELALEQLTGSVFSLPTDLADTWDAIKNAFQAR